MRRCRVRATAPPSTRRGFSGTPASAVAPWSASRPTGGSIEFVETPVANPTSCCFGGPDLATLYVTSARFLLTEAQLRERPHEGAVLAIRPGVRGIEAYRLNPSGKTKSGLFGSFTRNPAFMGYRHADADAEWFTDFLLVGDGSKPFALYRDGRLVMIDIATGMVTGPIDNPLVPPIHTSTEGPALWLAVSRDGKYVVDAAGANPFTTQQPAVFRVYDAELARP